MPEAHMTGAPWSNKLRSRSMVYAMVALVPVLIKMMMLDGEVFAESLPQLTMYVTAILGVTAGSKGIEAYHSRKRTNAKPAAKNAKQKREPTIGADGRIHDDDDLV